MIHNAEGAFSEQQKLVASDRTSGLKFGYTVAVNGVMIVVGAWGAEINFNDNTGEYLCSSSV